MFSAPAANASQLAEPGSHSVTIQSSTDTPRAEIENNLSALEEGESYSFTSLGKSHTIQKIDGNFVVVGEVMTRSICATTIATVVFGIGATALAAAATMGPGTVMVIGGMSFTAGQVGMLAVAAGSFATLEAYIDSKFCR